MKVLIVEVSKRKCFTETLKAKLGVTVAATGLLNIKKIYMITFRMSFKIHIRLNLLSHRQSSFPVFRISTVGYYHVTHTYQSEFTPYRCLNVKDLLARNKREI